MTVKMTLPEKFFEQATKRPESTAFYYCRVRDHRWVTMTWNRYREEVTTLAGWLMSRGIGKGSKIGILSANRPEWIIADLAILSIGAISLPIYATASANDIRYIIEHAEVDYLFVDNLDRIAPMKSHKFKGIIGFEKSSKKQMDTFFSQITSYQGIVSDTNIAIKKPQPVSFDDVATIIYTSGTTGKPKGVIHTHGTLAEAMMTSFPILENPEGRVDRFFSFLPLSHVAERMLVEVGSISTGSEIAFARTVETLGEDLQRCRPTILLCVPRLWEKIYEKVHAGLLTANPLKKGFFILAETFGSQRFHGETLSAKNGFGATISDLLVGSSLREALGLDRARILITGAAPTRPEVVRFFGAFGMLLREVYGLTENLCLGVLNDSGEIVIGSCGKAFAGNEMKIAEDGEILFRAPWNFKGYYNDPEATREALSADGWLATGDLGKLDADGRLRIVGRKKELLKTSTGKYVAPFPIEEKLKESPWIKDAMLVGDERKYCVALVVLDDKAEGKPNSRAQFKDELKKVMKTVNEPLASFETVKRIGVINDAFTVENGALTATLKLKRKVVTGRNEDFIERLYHSEDMIIFEK